MLPPVSALLEKCGAFPMVARSTLLTARMLLIFIFLSVLSLRYRCSCASARSGGALELREHHWSHNKRCANAESSSLGSTTLHPLNCFGDVYLAEGVVGRTVHFVGSSDLFGDPEIRAEICREVEQLEIAHGVRMVVSWGIGGAVPQKDSYIDIETYTQYHFSWSDASIPLLSSDVACWNPSGFYTLSTDRASAIVEVARSNNWQRLVVLSDWPSSASPFPVDPCTWRNAQDICIAQWLHAPKDRLSHQQILDQISSTAKHWQVFVPYHISQEHLSALLEFMEATPVPLRNQFVWIFDLNMPLLTSLVRRQEAPAMRHTYMLALWVQPELTGRHGLVTGVHLAVLLDGLRVTAQALQPNSTGTLPWNVEGRSPARDTQGTSTSISNAGHFVVSNRRIRCWIWPGITSLSEI